MSHQWGWTAFHRALIIVGLICFSSLTMGKSTEIIDLLRSVESAGEENAHFSQNIDSLETLVEKGHLDLDFSFTLEVELSSPQGFPPTISVDGAEVKGHRSVGVNSAIYAVKINFQQGITPVIIQNQADGLCDRPVQVIPADEIRDALRHKVMSLSIQGVEDESLTAIEFMNNDRAESFYPSSERRVDLNLSLTYRLKQESLGLGSLSETFYFSTNSKRINFNYRSAIQGSVEKVSTYIKKLEQYNCLQENIISIEASTDGTGSSDYNLWLSRQRSEAAKNLILELGLGVDQRHLELTSVGEEYSEGEKADFRIRRVKIVSDHESLQSLSEYKKVDFTSRIYGYTYLKARSSLVTSGPRENLLQLNTTLDKNKPKVEKENDSDSLCRQFEIRQIDIDLCIKIVDKLEAKFQIALGLRTVEKIIAGINYLHKTHYSHQTNSKKQECTFKGVRFPIKFKSINKKIELKFNGYRKQSMPYSLLKRFAVPSDHALNRVSKRTQETLASRKGFSQTQAIDDGETYFVKESTGDLTYWNYQIEELFDGKIYIEFKKNKDSKREELFRCPFRPKFRFQGYDGTHNY